MTTFTASTFHSPVLSSAPGVHTRVFRFGPTGTQVLGDQLKLCRLPNKITILDLSFWATYSSGESLRTRFYVTYPQSSITAVALSTTISATPSGRSYLSVAPDGPARLSLSDDVALLYGELTADIITSATASTSPTAVTFNGYITFAWSV